MELEPITRQEKIIAGQDLTPITRLEMFLKQFGGGGGGGASSADVFIIHDTPGDTPQNVHFDKTTEQISEAYQSGKYCLVCLNGVFLPVVSVETADVRTFVQCGGFMFRASQVRVVAYDFVTNDGVTWTANIRTPILHDVGFKDLQISGSGDHMYTISVDADGNVTATAT